MPRALALRLIPAAVALALALRQTRQTRRCSEATRTFLALYTALIEEAPRG